MKLTTKEEERVLIFGIAEISRRRWKRGLKLNYIEASSIIIDEIFELAREGNHTLVEVIDIASRIITEEDVMEGTVTLLPSIMVEPLFPDGNKLVSVPDPIRLEFRHEAIPMTELLTMQN